MHTLDLDTKKEYSQGEASRYGKWTWLGLVTVVLFQSSYILPLIKSLTTDAFYGPHGVSTNYVWLLYHSWLKQSDNRLFTCWRFRPWFTNSRPTLILGFTMDFPKSVCEIANKNETLSKSWCIQEKIKLIEKTTFFYGRILWSRIGSVGGSTFCTVLT